MSTSQRNPEFITEMMHSLRLPEDRDSERNDGSALPVPHDH
jgi:hypothetical protein